MTSRSPRMNSPRRCRKTCALATSRLNLDREHTKPRRYTVVRSIRIQFVGAYAGKIGFRHVHLSPASPLARSRRRNVKNRSWERCTRFFSQIDRWQGIRAWFRVTTRPRRTRILQSLLPGLQVHLPFSRTGLQAVRRR